MHAPLLASAPDCPLQKFRIVPSNGHEARFLPLSIKHHGHPASKRTILVLAYNNRGNPRFDKGDLHGVAAKARAATVPRSAARISWLLRTIKGGALTLSGR